MTKKVMKHKLICFDLDGTIIDETIFIWQTLHDALGTDKDERQIAMDSFFKKEISYAQWAEKDVAMWRDAGATKSKMLHSIQGLKLMDGALDVLKELKKRGYVLAIISGSLDIALKYVLPNYKEYFDYVYINKINFNGEDIKGIEPTKFDFEHKAAAMHEICKQMKISPEEVVFVGDHHNDVHIADEAGMSIAFNCKSDRLAQIADFLIDKKDLREILSLVD